MKTIYLKPEIEVIVISLEEGACVAASGTESFDNKGGAWD